MSTRRIWVISVLLMLGTIARAELHPSAAVARSRTLKSFPVVVDRWTGVDEPRLDARILAVLGADDYVNRIYDSPTRSLSLFVAYYRSQAEGDSIHSPLNCLPGSGWEPVDRSRTTVTIPSGTPQLHGTVFDVNRLIIQKGEERRLVLYWYQTRSRVIASEYWNKFFLIADAFSNGRTDAALVRVISPIDRVFTSDDSVVAADTAAFAGAVLPLVNLWLFH
jgi:EpsI family protein